VLKRSFHATVIVGALLATGGCATARHEVMTPAVPAAGTRGIIFSVDGAGGFDATSDAVRKVVAEECLPLTVDVVHWSHGYGRVLSDEMDYCHARSEGERLACQVSAYRQNCPHGEVYLLAHSAGAAVVLAAAEALPPGSVERIILLAPSVSDVYDLRPALNCARGGIDVFFSTRDWGYLGVGTSVFGTADRHWLDPPAGRTGFIPVGCGPEDMALYAKLRQHAWNRCVAWTGNQGGHYGSYRPAFLRSYVAPLLSVSGR
jgi:pimeloyl-ACP methyl ester carboxylesterase